MTIDRIPVGPSALWLVVGLIALGVEAAGLNLIFLFVAIAALFAGCVAGIGASVLWQTVSFIVAGLVLPGLLRPRLLAHLSSDGVISRTEALVGEKALVTQAIDPALGIGRVVANGHDWAARCTAPVSVGTLVMVHGADGIVLLVSPFSRVEERVGA
jgi:membrane protein implicated in regulation of membrane protease activity